MSDSTSRPKARTIAELKTLGYRPRSIKEELRANLITALREKRPLFPGIVGYEKTVIPQIINAILARHDIILLGLRGQAKTRIARQLLSLLDEWVPVLPDFPLNEDPLAPVTAAAQRHVESAGDECEIDWMHRDRRYGEKLATPDVSMADLIGDIDPIKAANLRLDYSSEEVIHYGIIPRTNRGIFCINEIPDLAGRIQVGLLNIMQERDIQIRGFPVRLNVDLMIVFTANPEDYTQRGSIITPLKDRIESQIMTHYPRELDHAMTITAQEAWVDRGEGSVRVHVPPFLREVVEEVAFAARESDYLDQSSGVSARLSISLLEAVISNAERRGLIHDEAQVCVRPIDFQAAVAAVTGKVELVYQGEQEGALTVARHLIGKGMKAVFDRNMPDTNAHSGDDDAAVFGTYKAVIDYFSEGNVCKISDEDDTSFAQQSLDQVTGLADLAKQYIPMSKPAHELPAAMEFILEGLHQHRMLGKEDRDGIARFYDALGDMLEGIDTENT